MATPLALASQEEEKYSLLITGDLDQGYKLMSGINNGFPQPVESGYNYLQYHSNTRHYIEVDGIHAQLDVCKFSVEGPWNPSASFDYYRQANGVLILYDITDEESLEDVKYWTSDLYRYSCMFEDKQFPIMLVGSNIEKREEQKVSMERMRMVAEEMSELKLKFAEVSTVTGENVETSLQAITRDMIAHRANKPVPEIVPKKHCVLS